MNIKLICASLLGVSSIGGAVASGIYLSKSKNSQAKTDSTTKSKPKQDEAQSETTTSENTVTEETRQNLAQNTGSSGATTSSGALPAAQVAQGTSLTSGAPTVQEPLRT